MKKGSTHKTISKEKNKLAHIGKIPWNKGKKVSSNTGRTLFKKGQKGYWAGKKRPNMSGENNWLWKGGVGKTRAKYAPRPRPEQCEVCGAFGSDTKNGICLDHDHATNKFRGWLCTRCNAALGMVKDNTETLIALSEYLKKSRI